MLGGCTAARDADPVCRVPHDSVHPGWARRGRLGWDARDLTLAFSYAQDHCQSWRTKSCFVRSCYHSIQADR